MHSIKMIGLPTYQTYKRYRSLQTHVITSLPLAILMPHSACNCRCVMCDIWKGNKNLKQLTEHDINRLLQSLKKLGTQLVLMSGGEALLNPSFFRFCELLCEKDIRVSLLSTGLTLKKNADDILRWVNDVIVSLDGNPEIHNQVRDIPDAFERLSEGVKHIRNMNPAFRITGRTVIQKLNFRHWSSIIECAEEMGLGQISFLPADVSSHAFNREVLWNEKRQSEIIPAREELEELKQTIEEIIRMHSSRFANHFIAESPEKLRKIHQYYAAIHGLDVFPYKKCNAPWVSAVVEPDGKVRPCFFHATMGNIREDDLTTILNKQENIRFRKQLDVNRDETCMKCVCHLNLSPFTRIN